MQYLKPGQRHLLQPSVTPYQRYFFRGISYVCGIATARLRLTHWITSVPISGADSIHKDASLEDVVGTMYDLRTPGEDEKNYANDNYALSSSLRCRAAASSSLDLLLATAVASLS